MKPLLLVNNKLTILLSVNTINYFLNCYSSNTFRYESIYLHERNMDYTFLADWEGTWIMYQIQRQAALENTGAMTSTNLQIWKKTL